MTGSKIAPLVKLQLSCWKLAPSDYVSHPRVYFIYLLRPEQGVYFHIWACYVTWPNFKIFVGPCEKITVCSLFKSLVIKLSIEQVILGLIFKHFRRSYIMPLSIYTFDRPTFGEFNEAYKYHKKALY